MRVSREKYQEILDELARYLYRRERSAEDIAREFDVDKFTAYKRIAALKAAGVTLYERKIRRAGITGPAVTVWRR